jgi:AraC-like DNA-binding protein
MVEALPTPISRQIDSKHGKMDIYTHGLPPQTLADSVAPALALSTDYPNGFCVPWHSHARAQLLYAVSGVMVVGTATGHWVAPPNRAIWLPADTPHWTRMAGQVRVRTLYLAADAARGLPEQCGVQAVSPLLRELIIAAMALPDQLIPDSRNARLLALLLDELRLEPTLPLNLPQARDARLRLICDDILAHPDQAHSAADWGARLGIDPKTVQRLFLRDTGMTFGRWREQARLLLALQRLAQGERVLDVALDHGYSNPSAFAAMFKKHFGVTPSGFFA